MDRGDERSELISFQILHLVDGQQNTRTVLKSGLASRDEYVGEVLRENP